ncbi:MAG: DUF716 domain-containing protein [Gemmatimonadota bacterium]|jgi:hypothetical protein
MAHAETVAGTFWGHALPGSLLILWALYWVGEAILGGDEVAPGRTLESGLVLPIVKIVLAVVGVFIEIPGDGWYPQDVMMNWQHVTMYSVFGLSGIVDLLARRGLVSGRATYVAYAAAMANAGFLFWGHSSHGGVEGIIHAVLALVFFAVAALAVVEILKPSEGMVWGRIGAQLLLGSWFIVGAWIIYRSGWDLADPVREGWTYTVFSWTAAGASIATLAALFAARAARRS